MLKCSLSHWVAVPLGSGGSLRSGSAPGKIGDDGPWNWIQIVSSCSLRMTVTLVMLIVRVLIRGVSYVATFGYEVGLLVCNRVWYLPLLLPSMCPFLKWFSLFLGELPKVATLGNLFC